MLPQVSRPRYWRKLLTPCCQAIQWTSQMQRTVLKKITLTLHHSHYLVYSAPCWCRTPFLTLPYHFLLGLPAHYSLSFLELLWDCIRIIHQGWKAQEGRCNSKLLWHLYLELLLRSHGAMSRLVLPFIMFTPSPTAGPWCSQGYSLIEECKEVSHYNQSGLRQVQKHFPDVERSLL